MRSAPPPGWRLPSGWRPALWVRGVIVVGSLLATACSMRGPGDLKAPLQLDESAEQASAPLPKSTRTPAATVSTVAHAASEPPPAAPAKLPAAETVPTPGGGAPAAFNVADVLQAVLQNHPALSLRRQEVEAARARLITAGLLPNPQVVLDTITDLEERHTEMATRLMFTVPLGPKRRWRTAAACTAITEQQLALSRETRGLLLEAADAALEVHYLQEQAALHVQLTELENRLVAIQKDLFEAAATPYRSVVLAALATGNAELSKRETAARLAQAQVRLARAMGSKDTLAPLMQGTLAVEPVPSTSLDAVLNRAQEVAPELAQSHAAVCESQQQLAFEQWKAVPDLSIGPRTRYSLDGPADNNVGARVALDLPLFDRNQGRIAESVAVVNGNCARVAVAEIATLNDVRAAYVALYDAQSRWDYYRSRVGPQMEQAERMIREAFNDRAVPAYELTALLEAFARMRLTELELRYQHQRLRTRLELVLECRLQDLAGGGVWPATEIPSAPLPPR